MNQFDLFDSIGNVDDELIEQAKKNQKSHKKQIIIFGSIAACALLAVAAAVSVRMTTREISFTESTELSEEATNEEWQGNTEKNSDFVSVGGTAADGGMESETLEAFDPSSHDESEVYTGEGVELNWPDDIEIREVHLYFDDLGKISEELEYIKLSDTSALEDWKEKNNIEDDTEYLRIKMYQNKDEQTAVLESKVIVNHSHEVCSINTENLTDESVEGILKLSDSKLLLQTLKKTVTEYIKLKNQDYMFSYSNY